jgi:uncharacterized protein (TIRG00374 family)
MYSSTYNFINIFALYGVIALFSYFSPTPRGIGIAEAIAQYVAISLGIPSATALLTILTYRFIVLWFPVLMGLILFSIEKRNIITEINGEK